MKILTLLLPAIFGLSLCGAVRTASALTPTDPRTVINAVNTPGDVNALYVITTPGSYYLDANLVGEAGKSGIRVDSDNVQVDLMGFHLQGASVGVTAIRVANNRSGIAVANGSIANWISTGVGLNIAANVQVRDLEISACSAGIAVGADSVVERCTLFDLESFGVIGQARATVANCKVRDAGVTGIAVGQASIVRDSTVSGGTGTGIITGIKSLVIHCTVTNNVAGIVGEGGLVADCSVSENTANGVQLYTGTVRGCEISSNGGFGIYFSQGIGRAVGNRVASNGSDGILAVAGARIEENDVRSHAQGAGIRAFGTGSFVVKNTLFANSVQLSVPNNGNFVGPLVLVNAVNGRNEPWANFYGN